MTNQLIIDFPDMSFKLEKHFLEHKEEIRVSLWKDGERVKIPLKWNGSRICCPVKMWFDLPDNVTLTVRSDKIGTEVEK